MMATPLRVLEDQPEWQREEARIERIAGLDEFAADAETAYELLTELPKGHISRKVIDYRFHRALNLIARAGVRARAAEAELRGLSGETA